MLSKAQEVANQCWSDSHVSDYTFDPILRDAIAAKIDEYIDALRWCSQASAFRVNGEVHEDWKRRIQPLI